MLSPRLTAAAGAAANSVIVAISTSMITNTATPSPRRRRPLSSSSGTPPARLGSITGLAASRRAASVFAFTARFEQAQRPRLVDARRPSRTSE
jgi:hypothetical protein